MRLKESVIPAINQLRNRYISLNSYTPVIGVLRAKSGLSFHRYLATTDHMMERSDVWYWLNNDQGRTELEHVEERAVSVFRCGRSLVRREGLEETVKMPAPGESMDAMFCGFRDCDFYFLHRVIKSQYMP